MATSIYIPAALLAAVDRRARRLSISRNKLIVRTLAESLAREDEWDAELLGRLERAGPGVSKAIDEMLRGIRSARTAKAPPKL